MLRMVMAAVAAPEGGGVPPLPVRAAPKAGRKKRAG
jgi:hypothetical protein